MKHSDATGELLYNVFTEFPWIPEELIANWVCLIKLLHERKWGWNTLPSIILDKETMTFIACHPSLFNLLGASTKAWRPSKANECRTYLVSILLAIECLHSNCAGWGTLYPEAQNKAAEIRNRFFLNNPTRLLDIYLPDRVRGNPASLIGPDSVLAELTG